LIQEFKVESLKLNLPAGQAGVNEAWGIVETVSENTNAFGYRFYPDKVKGEGFFIAAFKKSVAAEVIEEVKSQKSKVKSNKDAVVTNKEVQVLKPYLLNTDDHFFFKQNEEVIALPIHLEDDLATIQSCLYIKKAGVKLGALIRNELIPAHELALSNIISTSIPKLDIDKEAALQYLRKADISLESEKKGWVLLTYQQLPLGWIKVMPNRINNYYPREWRILNK
jgi:NOL1/NOP2/fmu family ribosome biogenesis protein